MNKGSEIYPDPSSLLGYLNVAANFRNHEFNIQMLRNAVFTGTQGIILGCYAATIQRHALSALLIALLGVMLSTIWWYYRASLYWVRFWECRCREVNDRVVTILALKDMNIFAGHPAGADQTQPPPCKYGGRTIKHSSVHAVLKVVPIAFWLLYVGLAIAAGTALPATGG